MTIEVEQLQDDINDLRSQLVSLDEKVSKLYPDLKKIWKPYQFALTEQQYQGCIELSNKVKEYQNLSEHTQKTVCDLIFNNVRSPPVKLDLKSNEAVQNTFPVFQCIYEEQIKKHIPIEYDFDDVHTMYCSPIREQQTLSWGASRDGFTILLIAMSSMNLHYTTYIMKDKKKIEGEVLLNEGDCLYIKPHTEFWSNENSDYMLVVIQRKSTEVKTWLLDYEIPNFTLDKVFR